MLIITRHPNEFFPEINHLNVYHQNKSGLCGFYAYHNAKCFLKAITAKNQTQRLTSLLDSQIISKFWKDYTHKIDMLLSCNNNYYVNKTDKKTLVEEFSPLERNHLRYLLMQDDEISEIIKNPHGIEVYLHPFLYAFGIFQHNIE